MRDKKAKKHSETESLPLRAAGVAVGALNFASDLLILLVFLLLIAVGCWFVTDDNEVYSDSDASKYETYRPESDDSLSFAQLQKLNDDVFAWLTVYRTSIDYPVVYAKDAFEYLNLDAEGNFSLGGSLFIEPPNDVHFSQQNSIIYGHHLEHEKMFGGLDKFEDSDYFSERRYGNLYFDGKSHGLEFFAFVKADAYDSDIYDAGEMTEDELEEYCSLLLRQATNKRNISFGRDEHLVLLSTCATGVTNQRYILCGRLTEEVYENTFLEEETEKAVLDRWKNSDSKLLKNLARYPLWIWLLLLIALTGIVILIVTNREPRRKKKNQKK